MRPLLVPIFLFFVMCSCSSEDAAKQALEQARTFAAQGKYKEALERHVWFHNHALEIEPSYYGVRLSYALADWVELGRKYPDALAKLKAIRDEKVARIVAGENDRPLFHDVEAINRALEDTQSTVRLFKAVEEVRPEFAKSIYDLADEALIRAGEYHLARRYLGDPHERLKVARQNFDRGMRFARGNDTPERRELLRKTSEELFESKVLRILTVLQKTDEAELAREIQAKALGVFASPVIQGAAGL